ncbi:hypothetical protein ACN27J_16765 [Solwaraspora sp. WMMB762]|uniref:hypothetical protein n=1 Tax=Solwaraspora sp. WMMB762 TaxID=3404120 RepID=UPI003B956751
MSMDIAALLYDALPGLYRDQDTRGELRAFLTLTAEPLAELYDSVATLRDDLYAATCRPEFIALVGSLVGAEVDTGAPDREQRAQVLDSLRSYRDKGTADEQLRRAERISGWLVHLVDGSDRLVRLPLLNDPDRGPDRPVTVDVRDLDAIHRIGRVDDDVPYTVDVSSPRHATDRVGRANHDAQIFFCVPAVVHTGRRPARLPAAPVAFTFADHDDGEFSLLDGFEGSPLTRAALAADLAAFAGTRRGFAFRIRGTDSGAPVVATDLSDPSDPRRLDGEPLIFVGTEVAVDPETGRFLADLAALGTRDGEFTVDYLRATDPDPAAEVRTFAGLTAGLARAVPAATVAVVTDARIHRSNPAAVLLSSNDA